jgi:predicted KAP-like P-loop ATPase
MPRNSTKLGIGIYGSVRTMLFDRYFHLAIEEGEISQAAMDRILAATGDRRRLHEELRALKKRGLLPITLDHLEAYKEQLPLDHAESLITAMFDACDDLPQTMSGMFKIAPMRHAVRIIHWYLHREPDPARKLQVLEASIRETEGLCLPVNLVSLEAPTD